MDRAEDAKEIQTPRERRGPRPILDPNLRRLGKAERSREQKVPRAARLGLPHRGATRRVRRWSEPWEGSRTSGAAVRCECGVTRKGRGPGCSGG